MRSPPARLDSSPVEDLKPVYLVCGDDEARIDAWRGRLRRRAEAEGGPGALELLDPAAVTPADVAAALGTLTMSIGTRYLLVDGVEGWKAGALEPLEAALADPPAATVLVLIARGRATERLAKAVERAGGEVRRLAAPKSWEMPAWVIERAAADGLALDPEAARILLGAVGARPLRLQRELEKLALMIHPGNRADAEAAAESASREGSPRAFDLADALVDADPARALGLAEELAEERPSSLTFTIVRRLREVHAAAHMLAAGSGEREVAGALRQPPWLAKKTIARARAADPAALERALCAFADLEVETRGGGQLDEASALTLTLARAASASGR